MIQYLNKLEEDRRLLLEQTKDLTVDQYNVRNMNAIAK